jgi:hypothetical protein
MSIRRKIQRKNEMKAYSDNYRIDFRYNFNTENKKKEANDRICSMNEVFDLFEYDYQ